MKNIIFGKNGKIGKNVQLALVGCFGRNRKLVIGKNHLIRSGSIIYRGVDIGDNFASGHNVLIRENNTLGNNVSIGTNSAIEPGNRIGNNVRIHSGCFLENVTLEDGVFVGPNVVFTDDLHPVCPRYRECVGGAYIEENVSIGANSTILPGVRIGKNSLIGAGTLVHKNVPPNVVFAGHPGKVIKKNKDLKCIKGFYESPYVWRDKKK